MIRLEKTLEVIKGAEDKRQALFEHLAKSLTTGLKRIGFNIRSESQIVALECGNEREAERVRDFLEQRDVFRYGKCSAAPLRAEEQNIIRFSKWMPTWHHETLTMCSRFFVTKRTITQS